MRKKPETGRKQIGVIFPDEGAFPYELLDSTFIAQWFADHGLEPVDYRIERTPGGKPMSLQGCADLAKEHELIPAANRLLQGGADVLLWACVSASFYKGLAYASHQMKILSGNSGIPATSSSLAMVAAVKHLGFAKVDVMMNYMPEVAAGFLDFLAECGLEVGDVRHMACRPEQRAFDLDYRAELADFSNNLSRRRHPILIPSTSLSSLSRCVEFETIAKRPVVTANSASIWHVLHLLGRNTRIENAGSIFA